MKKILLTLMVSFLATGFVMAQEPTKQQAKKKNLNAESLKKTAENDAAQKAKIEADKKRQTQSAASSTPSPKADLNKAAALTVENAN